MDKSLSTTTPLTKAAQLSLISLTITGILTSIHHFYRFKWEVFIPAMLVIFLPILFMRWYLQSGKRAALWLYGIFSTLIIIWFGIIDGGLDHTLLAINEYILIPLGISSLSVDLRLLPPSALSGEFFYELTGILSFIASLFAAYYSYKFIRAAVR
jgi:hypothetical protein